MSNEVYVIQHHGIKGQRWGIRRFQNEDGTRTPLGKKRERNGEQGSAPSANKAGTSNGQKQGLTDAQKDMLKKVAIAGATAAAVGVAAYGAYKYSDAIKSEAFQETMELGRNRIAEARNNSDFWERAAKDAGLTSQAEINNVNNRLHEKEMESVRNAAKANASSLRNAKDALKGYGRKGITDHESGREAWNNELKSRLGKAGYSYEDFGSNKTIVNPGAGDAWMRAKEKLYKERGHY